MTAHLSLPGIQTAVDIPLDQKRSVQVGRCIVTTVYLDSERPRGRIRHRAVKVVEADTGDGAVVDEAELRQLAALGLPTSFTSSQDPPAFIQQQQQRQQQQHPAGAGAIGNGSAGASWASSQTAKWLQAFDASSKRHYYIHPSSRQTQWEAPPGGDAAYLPPPLAWSERLWSLQEAAAASGSSSEHSSSGGNGGGTSTAAAAAGSGNAAVDVAASSHLQMQPTRPAAAPLQPTSAVDPAVARAPDVSKLSPAPATSAEQQSQQPSGANSKGHTDAAASLGLCSANGGGPGSALQPQPDSEPDSWLRGPLPRKLWKYWMQRYTLFARFDEGVLLDEEGWFSVTPEAIARHHAQRCACDRVVDPFAGVGGNVIQMAATCRRVVAGELSPDRASLIRHNAQVYGVADRVEVRCCDFWDASAGSQADMVFLSPPWGGPQYLCQPVFSVHPRLGSLDASLGDLLRQARGAHMRAPSVAVSGSGSHAAAAAAQAAQHSPVQQISPSQGARLPQQEGPRGTNQQQSPAQSRRGVAVFLPKNTDLRQLSDLVPPGATVEVERNILDGFFKGITVYFWEH